MNRQIFIAAGGTAGHLYPGLALARELIASGEKISFVVRKNDIAKQIIAKEISCIFEIPQKGMPRRISLNIFSFIVSTIVSFMLSFRLLKAQRPSLVIGMGGHVSFPIIVCARLLKIPALIHEQNVVPGLANKVLALFASNVAISFESSMSYFNPEKTVYTGNPIRREMLSTSRKDGLSFFKFNPERFTIVVFGGSLGASALNKTITASLAGLQRHKERIQIIHLTGRNDIGWVSNEYKKYDYKYWIKDYLDEMHFAYACADLVISRSGAATVTELKYLGKQCILIPYPHATNDHQYFNALELEKIGIAKVFRENVFTPDKLIELISEQVAKQAKKPVEGFTGKLPQETLAAAALGLIKG